MSRLAGSWKARFHKTFGYSGVGLLAGAFKARFHKTFGGAWTWTMTRLYKLTARRSFAPGLFLSAAYSYIKSGITGNAYTTATATYLTAAWSRFFHGLRIVTASLTLSKVKSRLFHGSRLYSSALSLSSAWLSRYRAYKTYTGNWIMLAAYAAKYHTTRTLAGALNFSSAYAYIKTAASRAYTAAASLFLSKVISRFFRGIRILASALSLSSAYSYVRNVAARTFTGSGSLILSKILSRLARLNRGLSKALSLSKMMSYARYAIGVQYPILSGILSFSRTVGHQIVYRRIYYFGVPQVYNGLYYFGGLLASVTHKAYTGALGLSGVCSRWANNQRSNVKNLIISGASQRLARMQRAIVKSHNFTKSTYAMVFSAGFISYIGSGSIKMAGAFLRLVHNRKILSSALALTSARLYNKISFLRSYVASGAFILTGAFHFFRKHISSGMIVLNSSFHKLIHFRKVMTSSFRMISARLYARAQTIRYFTGISALSFVSVITPNIAGDGSLNISNVTGTLSDGQAVALSGSGFGSNPLTFEWLGANIEAGTAGNEFSKTNWLNGYAYDSYVYATDQKHSGSKSIKGDASGPGYGGNDLRYNGQSVGPNTDLFMTWWVRRHHSATGQWKMLRLSDINDIVDHAYEQRWFNWDQGYGYMLFTCTSSTDPTQDGGTADYGAQFPPDDDVWYRIEFYMHTSEAGNANGNYTYKLYTPGESPQVHSKSNILNWDEGGHYYDWYLFQGYFCNGITAQTVWMDDVFIQAGTQARVEIGDNSNWNNCTHKEIQPPSAWSSNSITITLNKGSFSSGTAYLFVVDSTGAVSSSYSITLV